MTKLRVPALFLALVLIVASCGDTGGEPPATEPTTTTGPAPTTSTTSTTLPVTTTTTTTTTTEPVTTTSSTTTTTTTLPATTTTTRPEAECSAAGTDLSGVTDPVGVPETAAAIRKAILTAAVGCDFEGLAALGLAGDLGFTYSFGGGDDPAGFWRAEEAAGEPVLQRLVQILTMSHGSRIVDTGDGMVTFYFWPAAAGDNPTDADWEEVLAIYTAEEIQQMRELGDGYLGWRAGITDQGDWTSFVAGD